jgi:transposase InsO family protein
LHEQEVKTLFIEPGSPWVNGYIENFNGKLRDEPLNREIFYPLEEAKILIEIGEKSTIRSDHIACWGLNNQPRKQHKRSLFLPHSRVFCLWD